MSLMNLKQTKGKTNSFVIDLHQRESSFYFDNFLKKKKLSTQLFLYKITHKKNCVLLENNRYKIVVLPMVIKTMTLINKQYRAIKLFRLRVR